MIRNKKYIMAAAAILILIFHLWAPIFSRTSIPGQVERFIMNISYIGVDIFFFISAYSIAARPPIKIAGMQTEISEKILPNNSESIDKPSDYHQPYNTETGNTHERSDRSLQQDTDSSNLKFSWDDYRSFIFDRAIKILPLFAIALAFGKFLWFVPGLMIVYLLMPLLIKVCKQHPAAAFVTILVLWFILCSLIFKYIDPKQKTGIFLMRIPVILIGAYASGIKNNLSNKQKLLAGFGLLFTGIILSYNFAYLNKLSASFKDLFYIMGIPLSLALILLVDSTAEFFKPKAAAKLGEITLELYFVQIVIGAQLVKLGFRISNSSIVVNLISFIVCITAAFILSKITGFAKKQILQIT